MGQTFSEWEAFKLLSRLFHIFSTLIVPVLMILFFVLFFYGIVRSLFEPFKRRFHAYRHAATVLLPSVVTPILPPVRYFEAMGNLLLGLLMIFLIVVVPMILIIALVKVFTKMVRV